MPTSLYVMQLMPSAWNDVALRIASHDIDVLW
jgi:hypothetical protein